MLTTFKRKANETSTKVSRSAIGLLTRLRAGRFPLSIRWWTCASSLSIYHRERGGVVKMNTSFLLMMHVCILCLCLTCFHGLLEVLTLAHCHALHLSKVGSKFTNLGTTLSCMHGKLLWFKDDKYHELPHVDVIQWCHWFDSLISTGIQKVMTLVPSSLLVYFDISYYCHTSALSLSCSSLSKTRWFPPSEPESPI